VSHRPTTLAHVIVFACVSSSFFCAPCLGQFAEWNDLEQRANQLVAQSQFSEALPIAKEAVSVAESTFGKTDTNYGISVNGLGYVQFLLKDYVSAEKNFDKAEEVLTNSAGPESILLITTLSNKAGLFYSKAMDAQSNGPLSQQYLRQAESANERAYSIALKNFPNKNDMRMVPVLEAYSFTLVAEKKLDRARAFLQQSLAIEQANLASNDVQIARTRNELGWILENSGDRTEAVEQYQAALQIATQTLQPQDPFVSTIKDNLSRASSTTNNVSQQFVAVMRQVIASSQNGFRNLRGEKEPDFKGDHLWYASPSVPGARKCEIWEFRDSGYSYSCSFGPYATHAQLSQDFAGLKALLQSVVPNDWKFEEKSYGGLPLVKFSNSSTDTKVKLSENYNGTSIRLMVDKE